ncbi:MAG: signal peptidase II [Clostridiales bacterium]|jgi:signal peptidase II|nr:signal peptidase II [Clostridiales bacterium]
MVLPVVVFMFLVAIDQFTKWLAFNNLKDIGSIYLIEGVFNFTFVENRGAAFGLLQGARWFFVISTIIIVSIIIYYYIKMPKTKTYNLARWCLVLILSGAAGNFIDRLLNGYVIDFLHATFIKFMNFPVFNLADTYVVVGALLLAVLVLFFIKEDTGVRNG